MKPKYITRYGSGGNLTEVKRPPFVNNFQAPNINATVATDIISSINAKRLPFTTRIVDNRKIHPVTGKPVNPNKDLKTGTYYTERIYNGIKAAKSIGVDPYTLVAIGLQESNFGQTDENVYHNTTQPKDFVSIDQFDVPSQQQREALIAAQTLKEKMSGMKTRGSSADSIQRWNGTGLINSKTEKAYHKNTGRNSNTFYGLDVTNSTINTKKNPVFGKTILSLRDVLKQNKDIRTMVDTVRSYESNQDNTMNYIKANPKKKLSYGGSMLAGAGSMASTGAGIGATFGGIGAPIGAAAGAVMGATMGYFDERAKKKQEAEQLALLKKSQYDMQLINDRNQSMAGLMKVRSFTSNPMNFYAAQGGVIPTSSNTQTVVGKPHEQGGVDYAPNVELEGGEVTMNVGGQELVFSRRLTLPNGMPIAAIADMIAKKKGQIEKSNSKDTNARAAGTNSRNEEKTAILDKQLMELFAYQQQLNGNKGGEMEQEAPGTEQAGEQMSAYGGYIKGGNGLVLPATEANLQRHWLADYWSKNGYQMNDSNNDMGYRQHPQVELDSILGETDEGVAKYFDVYHNKQRYYDGQKVPNFVTGENYPKTGLLPSQIGKTNSVSTVAPKVAYANSTITSGYPSYVAPTNTTPYKPINFVTGQNIPNYTNPNKVPYAPVSGYPAKAPAHKFAMPSSQALTNGLVNGLSLANQFYNISQVNKRPALPAPIPLTFNPKETVVNVNSALVKSRKAYDEINRSITGGLAQGAGAKQDAYVKHLEAINDIFGNKANTEIQLRNQNVDEANRVSQANTQQQTQYVRDNFDYKNLKMTERMNRVNEMTDYVRGIQGERNLMDLETKKAYYMNTATMDNPASVSENFDAYADMAHRSGNIEDFKKRIMGYSDTDPLKAELIKKFNADPRFRNHQIK